MCIQMPVIDATIYIFKKEKKKRYLYLKHKNKCEKNEWKKYKWENKNQVYARE